MVENVVVDGVTSHPLLDVHSLHSLLTKTGFGNHDFIKGRVAEQTGSFVYVSVFYVYVFYVSGDPL